MARRSKRKQPKQKKTPLKFMDFKMDSPGELDRARYLWSLQDAGIITDLILDKKLLRFVIQEAVHIPVHALRKTNKDGKPKKMPAIVYTPDFGYTFKGAWCVEDYKGGYSNAASNRKLNRVGKPIYRGDSRLRIRLFQMMTYEDTIFHVVTNAKSPPANIEEYHFY